MDEFAKIKIKINANDEILSFHEILFVIIFYVFDKSYIQLPVQLMQLFPPPHTCIKLRELSDYCVHSHNQPLIQNGGKSVLFI